MTCTKAQGFLANHQVTTAGQVNAKRSPLGEEDALALIEEVDELYASKGKKLIHVDLKRERPDPATLLGLMLGPTGRLRAPTLRVGRTLIVGFDEEAYRKILG